jgi:hypothetical protein
MRKLGAYIYPGVQVGKARHGTMYMGASTRREPVNESCSVAVCFELLVPLVVILMRF